MNETCLTENSAVVSIERPELGNSGQRLRKFEDTLHSSWNLEGRKVFQLVNDSCPEFPNSGRVLWLARSLQSYYDKHTGLLENRAIVRLKDVLS